MQGLNLIAEIDRKLQITSLLAGCFQDYRSKSNRMLHLVESLIAQRIYGLIMGQDEDLNDHEELRHDPIFALALGKVLHRKNTDILVLEKLMEFNPQSKTHSVEMTRECLETLPNV